MADEREGAGGPGAATPGGAAELGPTIDSDVLAFFYSDAARAFAGLREDAGQLERYAARVGRFVSEVGLDASADVRREFHRLCELADRRGALTFRLIEILRD